MNRVLHGGSLEITVTVPLRVTLKFVDSPFEIKKLINNHLLLSYFYLEPIFFMFNWSIVWSDLNIFVSF